MTVFADSVVILLMLSFFCFIHSFLASDRVKDYFKNILNEKIAFYRISYNIISLVLLAVIYETAPKPAVIIYDLPYPYDIIVYLLQVLSLAGVVYSFSLFNFKEFLGFNQVGRWLAGEYLTEEKDEHTEFRGDKIYKYMRHPGYFFSILFMGLRPQMDVFYFTAFLCFSSYFYIGTFFEEKKLAARFGAVYSDYQKRTPRIFPFKFTGR